MFLKLSVALQFAFVVLTSLPITHSWRKVETQHGVEWALYECDGTRCRHVGTFRERDMQYLPFDGRRFGAPDCLPTGIDPPAEVQARHQPAPQTAEPPLRDDDVAGFNKGIDIAALREYAQHGPSNTLNGKSVSYETLAKRISSLADDSSKPHCTFVGRSQSQCDRVLNEVQTNPLLQPLRDKWRIQCYSQDAPTWKMVANDGFVVGEPSVYFQATDGRVLHRANYDGPEKLAQAERLADPNYDPAKDPNVLQPKPSRAAGNDGIADILQRVPGWAWGLAAAAAVILLAGVRKTPPAAAS